MSGRRSSAPLLLVVLLVVQGCETLTFRGDVQQSLTVHGRGVADPAELFPPSDDQFTSLEELRAEGEAELDRRISDAIVRVLTARAAARREALRDLARQVRALEDEDGQPLVDLQPAPGPEATRSIEGVLEVSTAVEYSETTSQVRAEAVVSRDALVQLLQAFEQGRGVADPLTTEQVRLVQSHALEMALREAKQNLNEALRAADFDRRRTFGQVMDDEPTAQRELQALIFLTQPDQVAYPGENVCQLTLSLDLKQAREIARKALK